MSADEMCGDYPAPCNCDDPETHDGAVTAADRPPRVGDQITTAAQLDALPAATYFKCQCDYHGTKIGDDLYLTGVRKHSRADMVENHLPVTVLYMPGEPSRPSVTDNARAEAWRRFPDGIDPETGEPVDDYGYPETAREAFIGGAEWAAGRAETTTGAIARGEALAAGDPDWMNVTRWPQDATTAATTEDAARVINEVLGGGMDNHARIAAHRLADAGLLLATVRTLPTKEQIARALREGRTNGLCKPGVRCNLCDCAQEYEDDLALRDADAVLDLLRDGAR